MERVKNALHPVKIRTGERVVSTVTIEIDLPRAWAGFQLPAALQDRLHTLLDRQDSGGTVTTAERREAHALTELVDFLTTLKLHSERTERAARGSAAGDDV